MIVVGKFDVGYHYIEDIVFHRHPMVPMFEHSFPSMAQLLKAF